MVLARRAAAAARAPRRPLARPSPARSTADSSARPRASSRSPPSALSSPGARFRITHNGTICDREKSICSVGMALGKIQSGKMTEASLFFLFPLKRNHVWGGPSCSQEKNRLKNSHVMACVLADSKLKGFATFPRWRPMGARRRRACTRSRSCCSEVSHPRPRPGGVLTDAHTSEPSSQTPPFPTPVAEDAVQCVHACSETGAGAGGGGSRPALSMQSINTDMRACAFPVRCSREAKAGQF